MKGKLFAPVFQKEQRTSNYKNKTPQNQIYEEVSNPNDYFSRNLLFAIRRLLFFLNCSLNLATGDPDWQ